MLLQDILCCMQSNGDLLFGQLASTTNLKGNNNVFQIITMFYLNVNVKCKMKLSLKRTGQDWRQSQVSCVTLMGVGSLPLSLSGGDIFLAFRI